MRAEQYSYYCEKIEKDFPQLVKETQEKLNASKTKADDFAILSVFYSKLLDLAFATWEIDEADELFNDSKAMMAMPESVGKQLVNKLFEIKNLNVLYDLGIYNGLEFIQNFIDDPTESDYEKFYKDCYEYIAGELVDEKEQEDSEEPIEECKALDQVFEEHQESLKEDVDPRPNHTKLLNYFYEIEPDWRDIAEQLLSFISDDEVGEFARMYGLEDELEEE